MRFFRQTVLLTFVLALLWTGDAPRLSLAQTDGAITIGTTDLPSTLDPGEAYDFAAWEVLSHLYTGLTRPVPGSLDYELALAEDVAISDDRLVYTFTLRAGTTFSDGTPVTAQTFVDSIERVLALGRAAAQAVEPYVESVSAPDERTLEFRLTKPVPYFLGLLALPPYYPVHPTLAGRAQPDPFAQDGLIGNGPYLLDAFDVRDQITLTANPAYDLGPQPATPTIHLKAYRRSQDLRDAVRNREVDVAWRALFLGHVLELDRAAIDELTITNQPGTRAFYLYMGQDREPADDPLVRQAVTLLLRPQTAVDQFKGYATALTSLVPDLFPDAYAPIWPDAPDVALAEETLLQAGYRARGDARLDVGISFSEPTYGNYVANAVALMERRSLDETQFVNHGVFLDIDTPTFTRMIERGETAFAIFGWTPIVPHPAAYLEPLAHSDSPIPRNGRYANPAIDALLDEAARLDDPAAQGALYREASALLREDFALVPLWQDHVVLVAWDTVEGIEIDAGGFLHYGQLAQRGS